MELLKAAAGGGAPEAAPKGSGIQPSSNSRFSERNSARLSSLDISTAGDIDELEGQLELFERTDEEIELLEKALANVAPIARMPGLLRDITMRAFARREFDANSAACEAGDAANSFYVVGGGSFEATSPEVNGGESSLGNFDAGAIISERVLYIKRVGRTPLDLVCAKAGSLFVLPKDAFFTIKAHVASGAGMETSQGSFLKGLSSLQAASETEVSALADAVDVVLRKKGEPILQPGSSGDHVMIWKAGTLRLPLPRPVETTTSGAGGGDSAPSVTFTAGDVLR
jgi:hypothetical protein